MGFKEMHEAAKKSGAVKKIAPEYYKWEKKGDSILGRLKKISPQPAKEYPKGYNLYTLQTDEGAVLFKLSGAADEKYSSLLQINGVYYFEYLGERDVGGKNPMKDWEITKIEDDGSVSDDEDNIPF